MAHRQSSLHGHRLCPMRADRHVLPGVRLKVGPPASPARPSRVTGDADLANAQKKIQFLPSADAYTSDMLEGEVAALNEQQRQTEQEIEAITRDKHAVRNFRDAEFVKMGFDDLYFHKNGGKNT